MSGIIKLMRLISTTLFGVKKILPIAFSVIMVLIQIVEGLILSIQQKSFVPFLMIISNNLSAIDYNIYQQVQIAINTPTEFGFYNISIIISSLIILRFFFSRIKKYLQFSNSNESLGGIAVYMIGIPILIICELVSVKLVFGKWVVPGIGIAYLLYYSPVIFTTIKTNIISTYIYLYEII